MTVVYQTLDWPESENDSIRAALARALEQQRMGAGMRIGAALLKRSNFDMVAITAELKSAT